MTQSDFKYRGARAMTILHEQNMRSCLKMWKKAKAAGVVLPQTSDSDYESMEFLLAHIFGAARGYMVWICKNMQLPASGINPVPALDVIEENADKYLKHLLEKWALPLVDIDEDRFGETYTSTWKIEYCIDAMMEHAVMHPIRHEFQLKELLKGL